MHSYQHQFKAPIESIKYGRMFYGGVFLPEAMLSALPQARERGFRLAGEVGGLISEFGLMPVKTSRFIVLSKSFLREAKLETGDVVQVRFSPIDPNDLELPIELEQALKANHPANLVWEKLTVGKRREYASRVAEPVREATRLKRAEKLVEDLMDSEGGAKRFG